MLSGQKGWTVLFASCNYPDPKLSLRGMDHFGPLFPLWVQDRYQLKPTQGIFSPLSSKEVENKYILCYPRWGSSKYSDVKQRYLCHLKAFSVASKDRLPWKGVHPLCIFEWDVFTFKWTKLDEINSHQSVPFFTYLLSYSSSRHLQGAKQLAKQR